MGWKVMENGRLWGLGSQWVNKKKFGKWDDLTNEPKISEIWIFEKFLSIFPKLQTTPTIAKSAPNQTKLHTHLLNTKPNLLDH